MYNVVSFVTGIMLFVFFVPLTAVSQEPSLPVDVQVKEMVNLPSENPEMKVVATDTLQDLQVAILEDNKNVVSKKYSKLSKDASKVFGWRAPPGIHRYMVKISGRTVDKQATIQLPVDVVVMRPLEVDLPTNNVDLENRRINFKMNNPSGQVEITILNALGRVIHEDTVDLSGRAAGTQLVVTWPELSEPIGKIRLNIADASGSWRGMELLPFRVDIPHVDVVFETARWEIRESQTSKLEDAYDLIIEAIKKYGDDFKARLYIVGHTDTVGSNGDNMVLSKHRANAIADYFKKKGGITLPILACGMGETSLAVKTEDNVDEQRNRRAQYIISAQPPEACDFKLVP